MNVLVILVLLALIAVVVVVLPVAHAAYENARRARRLTCPVTGRAATVRFDPAWAARAELVGAAPRRLVACSLRPERLDCPRSCLALADSAMVPVEENAIA